METLCGMYTDLWVCDCAYLSLVLQHVVRLPSAQLMAAACGQIQPAAQVQHPRRFPLPLAKRSGNKQNGKLLFTSCRWTILVVNPKGLNRHSSVLQSKMDELLYK